MNAQRFSDEKKNIIADIDWIDDRIEKMIKRQKKFEEGSEKFLKLQSRIERYLEVLDLLEEGLF